MQNHPHVVKAITIDITNGQSDDEWRKQHLARKNFENFKQRGEYTRWMSQEWKNRLRLAINAGLEYEQNDLINILMQAIDSSKFESIIDDYSRTLAGGSGELRQCVPTKETPNLVDAELTAEERENTKTKESRFLFSLVEIYREGSHCYTMGLIDLK